MNLFSKPYRITFRLIGAYLGQLYMNPVETKSITSCILAGLGNYLSQRLCGVKSFNHETFWAFAVFGLLFGGSIPHYFSEIFTDFFDDSKSSLFQFLLIERLFFMPAYLYFSLYILSRLEGKSHRESFDNANVKFPSVALANLKYLSLLQYINIFFVPPILRILFGNVIGFFWVVYLSNKRQLK